MNGSNILIIGANGQLGTALRQQFPMAQAVDSDKLDITNQESVNSFNWSKVKIVVNAAAFTNVDTAETADGRILAWKVNAQAVANLVEPIRQNDITFVHISTDYVFDGTKQEHSEEESFSPLSVYGSSKAAGDLLAASVNKHYILRTSWVIGEGNNFVRTMLNLGKKGVEPTVVNDQIGRLTFTSELVRAIVHLLDTQSAYGTYNVTNSGKPESWADITREVFKLANHNLNVTNISTAEYFKDKPGVAQRPLQSTLLLQKIQSTGFNSRDWKDDLKEYVVKELEK